MGKATEKQEKASERKKCKKDRELSTEVQCGDCYEVYRRGRMARLSVRKRLG